MSLYYADIQGASTMVGLYSVIKQGYLNRDYLYLFFGFSEAYRQFDDRASGSTVQI